MEPVAQNADASTEASRSPFKSRARFTIPILMLIAGLDLAAILFRVKSTQLDQEGVVTSAEIYDVSEDACRRAYLRQSDDNEAMKDASPAIWQMVAAWNPRILFAWR